jgi:glutamate/tyrosine decarboxylase-like PLP-dependent enzyme
MVDADGTRRMRVDALEHAIAEDVAAGVRPIAVIASAGTVNTGAIDPLADLAAVCARRGVWLHVDAAYGGPAILTNEYRDELASLALADSVALDPHKWMYVPVEAGFVLVRDGSAMRDAFSLVPPYIRTHGNTNAVMGGPWFSEYGFQQTRGFRALKVWMCLKSYGLAGYKAAIARNIALARYLAARVRHTPELELMATPSLSIVCFRYIGPTGVGASGAEDGARLDVLNRAVLERLQLGGDAFITSTELDGRFALRACVVNHRSTTEDIDRLVAAVLSLGTSAADLS